MDKIQEIIQSADIPSLPNVLQEILALADNPLTTSRQLEELVELEPGLSSNILKWVNSAFYGLPKKISSIRHAIVLLGFSMVKSIATGMLLINAFEHLNGLQQSYVMEVWRHSLRSANLMRVFAREESTVDQDDFFLAAMIHDVGHLVMSQHHLKEYDVLLEKTPLPSFLDEDRSFGMNHMDLGSALLKEWNFPDRVSDLVGTHHLSILNPAAGKFLAYLFMAEKMADMVDMDGFLSQSAPPSSPEWQKAIELAKVDWAALQERREEMGQGLKMVSAILNF